MSSLKITAYAVCAVIALVGCKKDDDPAPVSPSPSTPTTPTYPISGPASVSLSFDDSTFVYQENVAGYSNTHETYVISNPERMNFGSLFYNEVTQTTKATVHLRGLIFVGAGPTDQEFYEFFEPGVRPWTELMSLSGALVSYTPGEGLGAPHYTTLGFTQPSTSTFTITHSQAVIDNSGVPKVKIRATFNCILKNNFTGDEITVNNGIFVGVFKKY